MASVEECQEAVRLLFERIAAVDPEVRSKYVVNRTVCCRITDLDVVFHARLADEGLSDLRCEDGNGTDGAQVRLATASDDLLALIAGTLSPPVAWATGRLKVEASVLDLLKLRTLL